MNVAWECFLENENYQKRPLLNDVIPNRPRSFGICAVRGYVSLYSSSLVKKTYGYLAIIRAVTSCP